MSVTGIIAEFNPLHNGHKFLIKTAKQNNDKVIVVLSSDFVQRGDCAVFSKETRAKAAVLCGADIVIELPTAWSMSGAENFALGGVSLLKSTNVVDTMSFGVQSENLTLLAEISDYLESKEFKEEIKKNLSDNKTFAAIRENVLKEKFNLLDEELKDGNNILAIEYIRACKNLGFSPNFNVIKRIGAAHDSEITVNNFCSATYIRKLISENNFQNALKFIPQKLIDLYLNSPVANISNLHNAILFKLRTMSEDDFKLLPDISEGLENRIYKAVQSAGTYNELLEMLKTKRYTLSRIRRILLYAALGIQNKTHPKLPPYIRILGFNKSSENLVKEISKNSLVPVIINSSQAKKLTGEAKFVFETQSKFTDLYNLSFENPLPCGSDYTYKTVKLDM